MAGYSKIKFWEVWNFMSIEHGKAEFDERNIINFKGYNDSGKSAMLTALKVAITNTNPTKQVSFIQDDKDFFRVLIVFDDNIRILRDKYLNGQSLYEMYKGNDLLYSTKSPSGALTKVMEVPQPIADYLGLINYEKEYFNARACFEKQLGVQTSGSENYKMFNTVLKSEELSVASTLLNNDKNKLLSDIDTLTDEVRATKNIIGIGQYITDAMLGYLKEHDVMLDNVTECETSLSNIDTIVTNIKSIPNIPNIDNIETSDLVLLNSIQNINNELQSLKITPELSVVDEGRLNSLEEISNIIQNLSTIKVLPNVDIVEDNILKDMYSILQLCNGISDCDNIIKEDNERLDVLSKQLEELTELAEQVGVRMVKCPDCGKLFEARMEHNH